MPRHFSPLVIQRSYCQAIFPSSTIVLERDLKMKGSKAMTSTLEDIPKRVKH